MRTKKKPPSGPSSSWALSFDFAVQYSYQQPTVDPVDKTRSLPHPFGGFNRPYSRDQIQEEIQMPTMIIEAPTGIRKEVKKKLMEKTTAALNEAYPIPDVRIFLREYQADNVSQAGRLESEPVRPVCFIEAPQLRSLDARRKLMEKINAAVADAYEGIAHTREILILHHDYPLEHAVWAGRLQSDNPEVVEAIKKLNGQERSAPTPRTTPPPAATV